MTETLRALASGFTMPPLNDLLMVAPRIEVQITLAILHVILWYFLINYLLYPIGIHIISNLKSRKQFCHLNRETFKKMLMWDMGDDEETQIKMISLFESAIVQHLIGGMLCLPSAIGLGHMLPVGVASAMACHGGLSEIGWEVEDMLIRVYEIIFGGVEGRKKNPMSLIIFLIMHHSAACCMVIPMNIFYHDNVYYHETTCWLQLAAFVAFYCQQYGFTLNVKTQEGLNKMKISISISFMIIIWSRVIRYAWLLQILMTTIWEDQNWIVIKCAVAPYILLSLVNVLIVMDASAKFAKFVPMQIKKHSMDDIEDLAIEALSSGRHIRRRESFTGLNMSRRNWAKIRGAVNMGVIKECKEKSKKLQ